jgi:hypothetical protein
MSKVPRTPEEKAQFNEWRNNRYKTNFEYREKRKAATAARRVKLKLENPDFMTKRTRERRARQKETGNRDIVAGWRKFGGTRKEYERIYKEQQGCCAICERPLRSRFSPASHLPHLQTGHFDHCHTKETPRGILCRTCNIALGYYEKYIRKYREQFKTYLRRFR